MTDIPAQPDTRDLKRAALGALLSVISLVITLAGLAALVVCAVFAITGVEPTFDLSATTIWVLVGFAAAGVAESASRSIDFLRRRLNRKRGREVEEL